MKIETKSMDETKYFISNENKFFIPCKKEKEKMAKDDIRIKDIQNIFDKEKSDFNSMLDILLLNFKAKNKTCRFVKGTNIYMLPYKLYGLVNHLNQEILKYYKIEVTIVHADRIDATINIKYGNYLNPSEAIKNFHEC